MEAEGGGESFIHLSRDRVVVGGTEGRQLLDGSSTSVSGMRQQAGQACQGLSIP